MSSDGCYKERLLRDLRSTVWIRLSVAEDESLRLNGSEELKAAEKSHREPSLIEWRGTKEH